MAVLGTGLPAHAITFEQATSYPNHRLYDSDGAVVCASYLDGCDEVGAAVAVDAWSLDWLEHVVKYETIEPSGPSGTAPFYEVTSNCTGDGTWDLTTTSECAVSCELGDLAISTQCLLYIGDPDTGDAYWAETGVATNRFAAGAGRCDAQSDGFGWPRSVVTVSVATVCARQ